MGKIFVLYTPCVVGEEVYYVNQTKDGSIINYTYCTVKAIHIGRELKNKGNTYIVLDSTLMPHLRGFNKKISFKEFETSCFRTQSECLNEIKRRKKEYEESKVKK